MSPPPKDSLLKALSPKILTNNIKKNNNNPLRMAIKVSTRPLVIKVIRIIRILPITKGSSKIIMENGVLVYERIK